MQEVTDEPLYLERVCGIDVGKAGLEACIRVPSETGPKRRAQEIRGFGTTGREGLAPADWLRCRGVTDVVMECTGDYWKGPFYRLEAEGLGGILADARQVRQLPGRPKNDRSDSRWPAVCFARGAITPCFAATAEFRLIRLSTRYRRELTEERSREKQRAEKLLESAAIKLSSVVTDRHGRTGRDIMDRLIAGERDPRALARLARTTARRKIPQREEALGGAEFFPPVHARLLSAMLARTDQATRDLGQVSEVIEELLGPREEQLQQAEQMPGRGRRTAQDALAETGVEMTRFATPAHLVSRAGRSPLDQQSAGKTTRRPKVKKGNGTWPAYPARQRFRPAAPRPAKAPATGGRPGGAGKPKPRSPSAIPSSRSTTPCCLTPACAIRTSASATTTAATRAGRSAPASSASKAPDSR